MLSQEKEEDMQPSKNAVQDFKKLLLKELENDLQTLVENPDSTAYRALILLHQTPERLAQWYQRQIDELKKEATGRR